MDKRREIITELERLQADDERLFAERAELFRNRGRYTVDEYERKFGELTRQMSDNSKVQILLIRELRQLIHNGGKTTNAPDIN